MANLKLDLVNKLNNDKFYAELELVRLAQEPNMNYKEKIEGMDAQLEGLAVLNAKIGLVEQYFKEEAPAEGTPQDAPVADAAQAPAQAQQGQSHGE